MTTRSASEILAHARRSARKQDEFSRGGYHFVAIWDHILESQCTHEGSASTSEDLQCSVAPSLAWQEARQGIASKTARPFDWTFTSKYAGTTSGCTVEPTDETIDLERLKRQEPIGFYAQVLLYEDELADHGTAQMSVRLRVMPDFFFVLMRFYLRIDRVIVRVCDTRVVGDNDKDHVIREWSLREAKVADLEHLPSEVLLDGNKVWASLPILELKNEKISPTAT
ncbi:hypothetical protein KIN20_024707 [Parelaphostrongylus tenuis]|uniref:TIP41-like protein n=1 Tax=Parelaphostrongylus tenuis TaxID=148309 RepID=A0AAD5QW59_PARTN|nr:hypothetical protein KIN20_024707 [Parelaphostrongylus tenuis]